jgi:uncharacterized membrane protein
MASGAYSLAAALGSTRRKVSTSLATGLLASLLVVLIGNLIDFFKVIETWPEKIQPNFDHWTWDPSRAITNTITEFPYFTGLYADLHAHGINVPMTLVLLSLCLTVARDPNLTTLAIFRPRFNKPTFLTALRVGMLGLCVGTVATTNSWDAAEYVAFLVVAMFMTTIGIRPFPKRLLVTGIATGVAGVIALAMFLPFYAKYVALFNTVGRTRDKTSVIQISEHLGGFMLILGVGATALLLARLRGRVTPFIVDPVLPLAIVGAGLAVAIATNLELDSNTDTVKIAAFLACAVLAVPVGLVAGQHPLPWVADLGKGTAVALLLLETVLIIDERGTLALAVAFLVLGVALWLFADDRAERFTGALIACGAGIFGAIELVYLQDNLAGGNAYRMNTVFKFYNQVWVMLALASAVVLGKALQTSGFLTWIATRSESAGEDEQWLAEAPPLALGSADSIALAETIPSLEIDPVYSGRLPAMAEPTWTTRIVELPEEPNDSEPATVSERRDLDTVAIDDLTGGPLATVEPGLDDEYADWVYEWDDAEHGTLFARSRALMNIRWARATVVVGAIVVLMSLFYPVLATRVRLDQRFPNHPGVGTLNAYDWMRYGTIPGFDDHTITFNGDYDAIYWFINNVDGSPVIMEAAIGAYRGNGSRFSINTGMPAVIGWGGHETQQRYPEQIGPREQDVHDFYDQPDVNLKLQMLVKYGVDYVIVGDVERYTNSGGSLYASEAGIAAIESMNGAYLEIAFQSGGTTVYHVLRDKLPPLAETNP